MSSVLCERPAEQWAESKPVRGRKGSAVLWMTQGLLLILLAIHLPAFVRMPLDADATQHDWCARTVLVYDGVLYRDALETNLPGMPWLHMMLRSLAGWSPEVLRLADLAVVGLLIFALVRWLPEGCSATDRWLTVLILGAFYLSTSEWCHVQRDVWMLLPCLLALRCRRRQILALSQTAPLGRRDLFRPLLEGLLWGAAFWIKPFVAVPALFCWSFGAWRVVRVQPMRRRRLVGDALMLIFGGMLVGAAGISWLIVTGAWPAFWEIVWVWNRQYVTHDFSDNQRALMAWELFVRFFPWMLLPVLAIPLACRSLKATGTPLEDESSTNVEAVDRTLLAALYLGWIVQVVAFQHIFDYVYVPIVFLTLILLCRRYAVEPPGTGRTVMMACLLMGVALRLPAPTWQRLAVWSRCWERTESAELLDRLSVLTRMSWTDLERVEAFLLEQKVRDGEVACWAAHANPLYAALNIRPPSRYLLMHQNVRVFARQRERIWAEIAECPLRFVVCDLQFDKWKSNRSESESFPQDRLVFRAGRYAVYAVDAASVQMWIESNLEL
jgi:hypothetical protein